MTHLDVNNRGRTIVFIDNSNMFKGQQRAGWKLDMEKLHSYLSNEGAIWQTFFFASVSNPPRYMQTKFYNFIKNKMRWEVKIYKLGRKSIYCRECHRRWLVQVEKGVDVGLATKMLTLSNARAFDTAVLVAADKDYMETVQAIKNNGLRVEIVAWRGTISPEMEQESSSPVVFFDDNKKDLVLTIEADKEAEELSDEETLIKEEV